MYYPFGWGFDPTFLLLIPGIILALWAQIHVSRVYSTYSSVQSERGFSAADVASHMLKHNGLPDVSIESASGKLSDHYDPKTRTLHLSEGVHDSASIAALGIAAHEVGHAIQHNEGYGPMKIRSVLVPVANVGSYAAIPLIILGLILSFTGLIYAGIIAFSVAVLFQLVTLPVEFNASRRALAILEGGGYLTPSETADAKRMLNAAALTYVAATLISLLYLFRFILIAGGGRRRD
ncbi:MAG: zinc metallopeptidase [Bacillota bacterium]|nr:zinc metallopeptidase [Bacillota bacterium]